MQIAHVLSTFEVGGQERMAVELARAQRRAGHDVIAVSLAPPPEGPIGALMREAGARTFDVPKGPRVDPGLPARLAALFLLEKVRIVHTHNPLPLIYAGTAARLARARVVHTRHGFNKGSTRQLWLRRAAGRLAHRYVAVSAHTAELAREEKDCPPARLRVIDNGIDLSRFHPDAEARAEVRRRLGIREGAFVAGTVGRLVEAKDHAFLLRAFAPLAAEGAHVVVVGSGELEPALRAQAQSAGASGIHLVGLQPDVPRWLAAFDVFVLSSAWEGLPLVLPEAMATGLPCVCTAVGGVPGVVAEGETGYLVAHGDEAALADRLRRLRDDPALRATMSARARERAVAHYSADRMAEEYLALYRELVDS